MQRLGTLEIPPNQILYDLLRGEWSICNRGGCATILCECKLLQFPDGKEHHHQSPRHWRPRFIGALIGDADHSSGKATFVSSMSFLTPESWSKLTKML
jgi:hypothetical protein